MQALCKKNYQGFEKGKYYKIDNIHSIFQKDDFISLNYYGNDILVRFRLNHSLEYIEGYIGEFEVYFYDYFYNVQDQRKAKLEKLSNVTNL